ncbi:hypothetical protein CSV69_16080 [Sporosarcina sp. P26b]|uniref:STM4504/CBY_0614 family protein n=1 Tax=Sporosarcina sp. P26b TaxID=2048253 RepID=UPI000C16F301|nr:hypothetical protein [Sporosarcina sp. P26b]PIC94558.1 hypothetical protein CSV69_16080 [Sporosarcina sp. P26b]
MVFELFSRRNSTELKIDVYEYDEILLSFRTQFAMLISEVVNEFKRGYISDSSRFWDYVVSEVQIELGLLNLRGTISYNHSPDSKVNYLMSFLLSTDDKSALDVMDLLVFLHHAYSSSTSSVKEKWEMAVKRINRKLKENSLGYEIVGNQLIRVDNQYIHNEVVKTAIQLLQEHQFHAVSDEFLKAHEHYKQGDYKDAVVNAGKAFESTMKTICTKNGYDYNAQRDTANTLIKHLIDNELIPSYMQNHIQGLKQALENSANVLRNKNGGHGQGEVVLDVDDSIVRYTLNLCASNIVFLVERYKEMAHH